MDDLCAECGFRYDLDDATAAAGDIRRLAGEVAAVLGTPGDLATRRRPELWSPLEYACHLRDVFLVQRERVLQARRDNGFVCVTMGRDVRVEHEGYAEQNPDDVARQVTDAAQLFGNVLDRLGDDWDNEMVYSWPEPHRASLRWVAVHTVHEARHHLQDMRGQLA
ncbi:DinB family protein [Kutzneria kofuensis]|uniref:DinB-like domain-containing protein n=1 Tax=Kutzneria kofuensis TaxID=103725 RepID=A0A7W9NKC3_9PSEU|nr:DinB family protein [Kutzneria kofuensis]MBB5895865.1 hypothetical protein [Kutzneria kofuensis]